VSFRNGINVPQLENDIIHISRFGYNPLKRFQKNKEEDRMAPKTIKGKANIPGFNTDLEIDVVDDQYEVYDKDLPKDLPKETSSRQKITWFNNFGVRRKNSTAREKSVPQYRVFLQKLPEGKKLCAYFNGSVTDIPVQNAGPDKILFTLSEGDPPTGYYP
jgi:hypothetical protein